MRLSAVIGQAKAVAVLERAFESERPAQAYLLHGPEGVGKELTARALTAGLLCTSRIGADACGSCGSCAKLARGVHPDLSVVLPEDEAVARGVAIKSDFEGKVSSTIRVATIRATNAWLVARPVEGKTRVALILEAHRMGVEAQNSLLKTLEEPRAGRTLVLVTSAPSALLATVRSRCQKLRFGALDDSSVGALLDRILGSSLDAATRERAIRLGRGSAARALELASAGDSEQAKLEARLRAMPAGDALAVLELAESVGGDREQAIALVDGLSAALASLLRGQDPENPGSALEGLGRRRVADTLDQAARARQSLASGANVTLAIEDLLLGLSAHARARTSVRSAGR